MPQHSAIVAAQYAIDFLSRYASGVAPLAYSTIAVARGGVDSSIEPEILAQLVTDAVTASFRGLGFADSDSGPPVVLGVAAGSASIKAAHQTTIQPPGPALLLAATVALTTTLNLVMILTLALVMAQVLPLVPRMRTQVIVMIMLVATPRTRTRREGPYSDGRSEDNTLRRLLRTLHFCLTVCLTVVCLTDGHSVICSNGTSSNEH